MKFSILNKGLIAYYPLDKENIKPPNTVVNKTPYENIGTKYGGNFLKFSPYYPVPYIDLGDNMNTPGNITISTWIQPNNSDAGWQGFIGQEENEQVIYLSYSRLLIYKNRTILRGNTDLVNGQTYHVVMVYDGTNITLYLDGEDDGTVVNDGSFKPRYFGCDHPGDEVFSGLMGETYVYSRALSKTECQALGNDGTVSDVGLEAHYIFDGVGTILTDETGMNNGTLMNFPDTSPGYGDTHETGWVSSAIFVHDLMGKPNRAMQFNGKSEYIGFENLPALNNLKEEMSISVMIKQSRFDNHRWIVGKANNLSDDSLLYYNDNKIKFAINDLTNVAYAEYLPTEFDVWNHIVGTYSKTTGKIRVYVNNILGTDYNYSNDIVWEQGSKMAIASSNADSPQHLYEGSVAAVHIYKRELQQNDVNMLRELYRTGVKV